MTVSNKGKETHTFTIDAPSIDQTVSPGQQVAIDVPVPATGSVNFYCRFHRTVGMQGAIVAS